LRLPDHGNVTAISANAELHESQKILLAVWRESARLGQL
jgi:hypothetical protein